MDDNKAYKLIKSVRKNEIIWNLSHPFYKNLKIKCQAWKSVGKECGLSVDAAKRKWKGLRDSFAREMNKRSTSEKNVDAAGPQWKFTKNMNFLTEHMKLKLNNYDNESVACSWVPSPAEDVSTKSIDLLPEQKFLPFTAEAFYTENDAISSFDKYVTSSTLHPPTSKRTKLDFETNLVNTIKSVIDVLAEPSIVAKPSAITFEDELFCRSMSEKLSKFPLVTKNEAKLRIMTVLCDMEANLQT